MDFIIRFLFFSYPVFPESGSNPQDVHAQPCMKALSGLSCSFSDRSRSSGKTVDSPSSLYPPATHQRQVSTSKHRKLFPWQPPSHRFMLVPFVVGKQQAPGRSQGKAVGAERETGPMSQLFHPLQLTPPTHPSSHLGHCPLWVWYMLEGPYCPGLSITGMNC